jgi:hypothetical protein
MRSLPIEAYVWLAVMCVGVSILLVILRRRPRDRALIRESLFVVVADPTRFHVIDPSGNEKGTSWNSLERVLIRTTDDGPFLPDVFWVLEPMEEPAVVFPSGVTGEAEFLRVAQAVLLDFNNDQITKAMGCTDNGEFIVWERTTYCSRCMHTLPRLDELAHAQRLELRRIIDTAGSIHAMKHLRNVTGCDLKTAKLWVQHRGIAGQGHEPLTPCPHCGEPLRSAQAKQCRFCRRDWHDPERVRSLGQF